MNWKEFYKVDIFKVTAKGESLLYKTAIAIPEDIPVHELFMPKFGELELSASEKKKLCINTRKILHCRHLLQARHLRQWAKQFVQKIEAQKEKEIVLRTSGAGVYLILAAMELYPQLAKKIVCYTTEIPLKVSNKRITGTQNCQFIYGPHDSSFLGQFPSLWKSSPYLPLFNIEELKKAA